MSFLPSLVAVAAAYLVGSLSFAVIVSRAMGLDDPRGYGSRNPGATNVLRSGHRGAAIATLVLDALKGYLAVVATLAAAPRLGFGDATIAAAGLAVFVGHLWPVFFGFRGGKGAATAAGVLFAFDPVLGLATVATWAIIAGFFRYSSLASLAAAVFAPFYQLLFWGFDAYALAIVVMALLLVWRHERNIRQLFAGTEARIGGKPATGIAARARR